MNTKSIIEIFRGDDSDALGYQTIVGTIHTDLDLTGCKAVFRYLGFFQEFDPIPEDGKLTIVIPSASSMQFPPGLGYASLKVYDIDRKVRTFTNRIPVFVKTMTPCRGGGEFDVEFSPFPELEPLKIFKGPGADDFDLYTGFLTKVIDRASAEKYGLSMLFDAMDAEKTAGSGCAASPAAVKAAYDAIIAVLTDNYYTAAQTDEQIDKLAAYYITSDAQGNPFATHSALVNAQTYYSGGSVRTPTRNDYAIVIADETHNNEEWRYIYAENAQGIGQWEPQYAVEGVITFDDTVTRTSGNGVKSSGIWSMIWGSLASLPMGFSSLYDWVASKLSEYLPLTGGTLTGTLSTPQVNITRFGYPTWSIELHADAGVLHFEAPPMGEGLGSVNVFLPRKIRANISGTLALLSQIGILAFDSTETYAVGAKVVYNNAIWNCTTAVSTAGAWTGAMNWTKLFDLAVDSKPTANSDSLMTSGAIKTALNAKANDAAIAPEFSESATYAVDDVVMHEGLRYKCTTAVTTAGAWTPAHWTEATVEDVLAALRTGKADKPATFTAGNLAALDASGDIADAGYHFEVRGGIPCIVQYT